MPVMRSNPFLPAPNLAQAWQGGVKLAQDDEQLAAKIILEREGMANQAGIASANRGLEREGMAQRMAMQQAALAQEAQQAQMQDAMRREALQKEMLQKAQELEVEKAYKQQVIGLRGREVEQENKKIMAVAAAAEDELNARREYASQFEGMTNTGEVSPEDAYGQLMPQLGPRMNVPAGVMRGMGRMGSGMGAARMEPIEGAPEGVMSFQTGEGSRQIFDTRKEAASAPELRGIPGAPGLVQFGKTARTAPEMSDKRALQTRLQGMEDKINGKEWAMVRASVAKASDPSKKLTAGDRSNIKQFQDQQNLIEETKAKIAELEQIMNERSASSVTNRGTAILPPEMSGGSTNQAKRFRYNPETRRLE